MSREVIAKVLKERRKRLSLSVEMVSSRLKQYDIDVSPRSLYSYESGHRQPDADTLMALCEIYNIDNIMKEFGYTKKSSIPAEAETEEEEKLINDFSLQLQDALIYLGLIGEGQDLTPTQFTILKSVFQIVAAAFGKENDHFEKFVVSFLNDRAG